MNINEISPVSNAQPIKKTVSKRKVEGEKANLADKVEISPQARDLQNSEAIRKTALSALKDTPDIRESKINDIKAKIEQGHYSKPQVLNDIADRLIDSIA